MGKILVESHYLPCIEYFRQLVRSEEILVEYWENFQKQTYRNRCRILGANKVDILTVPVTKAGQKVLMKDVKIDYSAAWYAIHWRAIQSAYGKSPFFEYYGDYFQDILFRKPVFLWDLNMELMTLCLKLLRERKKIVATSGWKKEYEMEICDLRAKIKPKEDNNTLIHTISPYVQVFGSNFVPNLSIIDLLFNKGPDAGTFLS